MNKPTQWLRKVLPLTLREWNNKKYFTLLSSPISRNIPQYYHRKQRCPISELSYSSTIVTFLGELMSHEGSRMGSKDGISIRRGHFLSLTRWRPVLSRTCPLLRPVGRYTKIRVAFTASIWPAYPRSFRQTDPLEKKKKLVPPRFPLLPFSASSGKI